MYYVLSPADALNEKNADYPFEFWKSHLRPSIYRKMPKPYYLANTGLHNLTTEALRNGGFQKYWIDLERWFFDPDGKKANLY